MPMFFGKTLPSGTLRFNAYKVSLNFFKIRQIFKGILVTLKILIKIYKVFWIWLRVSQLLSFAHRFYHTLYAHLAAAVFHASFLPYSVYISRSSGLLRIVINIQAGFALCEFVFQARNGIPAHTDCPACAGCGCALLL